MFLNKIKKFHFKNLDRFNIIERKKSARKIQLINCVFFKSKK